VEEFRKDVTLTTVVAFETKATWKMPAPKLRED